MIKNNNQIFNKINVRKKCGRFNIYINNDNTLIYKKCYWSLLIKKLKQIEIFEDYKNIILNCNKKLIFGKHIINGFDVENNGSYMSNYIDGIRLDELDLINNNKIYSKVCKQIEILLNNLQSAENENILCGDWGLHNLIYSYKDDIIYNIDSEGFWTYKKSPKWCKYKNIEEWLNEVIYNYNNKYFCLILWNPCYDIKNEIINEIPNIKEIRELIIDKDNLHETMFDIYKLDRRCARNKVLPPKIEHLKKYNTKHLIIKYHIDNPTFTNYICNEVENLKKKIRYKYKNRIDNYIKDIIIHCSDDYKQSRHLWNNY